MSGYRNTERAPVGAEQWVGLAIMGVGLILVCIFATAEVGGADWIRSSPWKDLADSLAAYALLVLSGSFLFQAGMPDTSFQPARRSIAARRRFLRIFGWGGTALYLAVIAAAFLTGGR